MTYDTLSTQFAGCGEHIGRHVRRIVDVAALWRAYGRIAEWENERHVLRNQVVPLVILISFWLSLLSWIAGWDLGSATTTYAPAQTQSQTQAQPSTLGCR